MALLIDTPRWQWRGQLWAHLISDSDIDELHRGARALGLRYLSFGRDHYDVPESMWQQACEVATLVDSRDIVRALRSGGMRVRGGKSLKSWKQMHELPRSIDRLLIEQWASEMRVAASEAEVEVLGRPGELVVLVLGPPGQPCIPSAVRAVRAPSAAVSIIETEQAQRWSVEMVLAV